MSVINQLASSLGRKDEIPNQELAKNIVIAHDKNSIQELISLLQHKNKAIQQDSIKVLYEIGGAKPQLISDYIQDFIQLLKSKNNRMQWGAMTAIDTIAMDKPQEIVDQLPQLIEIAEKGSVITMDKLISIIIKLISLNKYDNLFHLLNEQLQKCPTNQLPMYAEHAEKHISGIHKTLFLKTLSDRIDSVEKESKKLRIQKVIKKLSK